MAYLKNLFSDIGRNLLAVCFMYHGLYILLNASILAAAVPSWLGEPYLWVILFGCCWLTAGISFLLNISTSLSGMAMAAAILAVVGTSTYRGFYEPGGATTTFLAIGFYLALAGGALMVAAQDNNKLGYGTTPPSSQWFFVIGRIMTGTFFLIAGIAHFANVEYDATLLAMMPWAEMWVIFVGICWIAMAVSLWTNIMSRMATILGTALILIITLMINMQELGQGDDFTVMLQIMQNLGLIGACYLSSSIGHYDLHTSSWRWRPKFLKRFGNNL